MHENDTNPNARRSMRIGLGAAMAGAPRVNLMRSTSYGMRFPNVGVTIDQVMEPGVQFAICDAAASRVRNND